MENQLQHPCLSANALAISQGISDFNADLSSYKFKQYESTSFPGSFNRIYFKHELPDSLKIVFSQKARDTCMVIEEGVSTKACAIRVMAANGLVYLGKNTTLKNVSMRLSGAYHFILVGAGVLVTSTNKWMTGAQSAVMSNGIIIGDHCLIAADVIMRAADSHLVMDLTTDSQTNPSRGPIVIEPYCWLGQRSAILKSVRIGACSIVAFGAVVTRSCDAFSLLSGVPAKISSIHGKLWLRNKSKQAKSIYEHYNKRFVPV